MFGNEIRFSNCGKALGLDCSLAGVVRNCKWILGWKKRLLLGGGKGTPLLHVMLGLRQR